MHNKPFTQTLLKFLPNESKAWSTIYIRPPVFMQHRHCFRTLLRPGFTHTVTYNIIRTYNVLGQFAEVGRAFLHLFLGSSESDNIATATRFRECHMYLGIAVMQHLHVLPISTYDQLVPLLVNLERLVALILLLIEHLMNYIKYVYVPRGL